MKNKRYIPTLWTLVLPVVLLTLAFPATTIQAQCNMSPSNLSFNLPQAGGNETQNFALNNCSGLLVSYYPSNYTPPSWVSVTLGQGYVTVSTNSANTGNNDRSTGFGISVGGNSMGGVTITQQGNAPPPGGGGSPPGGGGGGGSPACTVNYSNPGILDWQAGSQNYAITYSNCGNNPNPNYSFSVVAGDDFATLTPVDDYTLSVSVPVNNDTTSKVSFVQITDNNGQIPTYVLQIAQKCNERNWYSDSDNDGLRDPGSTAVLDCADPGDGWTTNTTVDLCPDLYDPSNDPPQNWYTDTDDDGLRDPGSVPVPDCRVRGQGWTTNTEVDLCPTFASDNNVVTTWYLDNDRDGHASTQQVGCLPPGPFWTTKNIPIDDCDDSVYDPENTCASSFGANPNSHNYVYSRIYQAERLQATPFFTPNDSLLQEITFLDGLGRPLQQVAMAHSPNPQGGGMQDLVTHMTHDALGRMEKEWLPYPTTGTMGNFRPNAQLDTKAHYNTNAYENTQNPYSEKAFEPSPLGRVLKQGAPGNDWKIGTDQTDHAIDFGYTTNTHDPNNVTNPDNDNIRRFTANLSAGDGNPSLQLNGYYASGELYKQITYDENHSSGNLHSVEEYLDKRGRTVLKRAYVDMDSIVINWDGDAEDIDIGERPEMLNVIHDTYYVYDDYGNLSYVLPPKVDLTDNAVSTTELEALCYQYRYDHRNRLIEKRIPGKQGWERIVYNKLDQPILTQDPNQAAQGEWLFTKYDVYGRVAYTGKAQAIPSATRANIQAEVDGLSTDPWVIPNSTAQSFGNALVNYNDGAYPTSNSNKTQLSAVFTINYYDTYDFDRAGAALVYSPFDEDTTTNTQGLPTGSKVRVLGTNDWITTVTHYDAKARPIHVYSKNAYLNTVDIVSSKLDFIGKPTKVRSAHTRGTNTVVTLDNYTYDTQGRLETHDQCIGDGTLGETCANANTTEQLVSNTYNGLGQLQEKTVGGGLQDVDYRYNVRGWLTGINDNDPNHSGFLLYGDLWGFRIHYNTPHNYGYNQNPKALYNGNIAQTVWRTKSVNNTSNPVARRQSYTYDAMNRIIKATDNTGNYNLDWMGYDKNGNIIALNRKGHNTPAINSFGVVDNLIYRYANGGNQLESVRDRSHKEYGFIDSTTDGVDYRYDANGSLVMDRNKGIGTPTQDGITYNHLNLPTLVAVDNGTDVGNISYVYDALGTKLQKTVTEGANTTTTSYATGYVYKNGNLEFFPHSEGYVTPKGSGYRYVYQYSDHLGNVRLSYTEDPSNPGAPTIIEENNYYPFGLKHRGYN
ncbi:MAG: DUF6443 domain-containing protein, partial [Bacteroidota bacterium]